jgi:hypothetical protein
VGFGEWIFLGEVEGLRSSKLKAERFWIITWYINETNETIQKSAVRNGRYCKHGCKPGDDEAITSPSAVGITDIGSVERLRELRG